MQEPELKIIKIKLSLKHGDTEEGLRARIRGMVPNRLKYSLGLFRASISEGVTPLKGPHFEQIHSIPTNHEIFCVEKFVLGQDNEFTELFLRFTCSDPEKKLPLMRPIYLHKTMEVSNLYLYVLRSVFKAHEDGGNYKTFFHNNYQKEEVPFDLTIAHNGTPIALPRDDASYMKKVVLERGSDLRVEIRTNPKFNFIKLNTCTRDPSCNMPVPTSSSVRILPARIEDCLRLYCRQESLGSQWRCPHCPSPQLATKTLALRRLPPILVLAINRFKEQTVSLSSHRASYYASSSRLFSKNEQRVRFGEELVVGEEVSVEGTRRYELYGVVVHLRLGGVTGVGELSGHYYAFVKTRAGWFKCDDEQIRQVQSEAVLDCSDAYLLFYRSKTHPFTT